MFEVRRVDRNTTTGQTNVTPYAYSDPTLNQPAMAGVFLEMGRFLVLAALLGIAGIGLSALSVFRKVRGLYAGLAMLGACALYMYEGLNLVLVIPRAAAPLAQPYGTSIPDFRGQITIPPMTSPTVLDFGPMAGWFLLLVIGLVYAWGASEMWHVRPSRKKVPAKTLRAEGAEEDLEARGEGVPPPTVEVAEDVAEEPDIEEVFVISSSGLLVKHMSRSLMSDKDRDVVGGMISVVSNFVKEAFTERDGEVHEVTLGSHRFVLASEQGVVVAVLVRRGETEDVVHRLKHLLALLFDRYGGRIILWDGTPLEGVEDELSVLWEPFFVPPPPAD